MIEFIIEKKIIREARKSQTVPLSKSRTNLLYQATKEPQAYEPLYGNMLIKMKFKYL